MISYITYDGSGKIYGRGQCPGHDCVKARREILNESCIIIDEPLDNPTAHYVHDGEVKPRPPMPATLDKTTITADDTDEATLTGLPDPCTVTIDETTHKVTGGSLTITSPMPATYNITCRAWPYLDGDYTLKAVEPE